MTTPTSDRPDTDPAGLLHKKCLHNISPANVNFEPRVDLLQRIQEVLALESVVVLSGLGGIGKSQLAKHFAHAGIDSQKYDFVWRMEARTVEEVDIGYRSIAAALGLAEVTASVSLKDAIATVHETLATSLKYTKWLLIIDDPKTEENLQLALSHQTFPKRLQPGEQSYGHVLLTSRSPHWVLPVISVQPFSQLEALHFVEKFLGYATDAQRQMLCEQLGYHPLALSQAVGYCAKTKRDVSAYLAAWRHSHVLRGSADAPVLDGYGHTVEATVKMTLDSLSHDQDDASLLAFSLAKYIAFFAATPIHHRCLASLLAQDAQASFGSVIAKCEELGLVLEVVQEATKFYQMHELTSEVIRAQIPIKLHHNFRLELIQALQETFDYNHLPSRALYLQQESTIIHAEKIAHDWLKGRPLPKQSEPYSDDWAHVEYLMLLVGYTCTALGRHTQAQKTYEQCLVIQKAAHGDKNFIVASTTNNLGEAWRLQGRFRESLEHYSQSLAIYGALENPPVGDMARSIMNTASSLFSLGEYSKCLQLYDKARALFLSVAGPNDADPANPLIGCGNVHYVLGEYDLALGKYEEALSDFRRVFGPVHPNCGLVLSNMFNVSFCQTNLPKAEELFSQAMAIYHSLFGDRDHAFIALTLANAAWMDCMTKNFARAEVRFKKSLSIEFTALTGACYASLLYNLSRFPEALTYCHLVIAGAEAQLMHTNKNFVDMVHPFARRAVERVLALGVNPNGIVNIPPKVLARGMLVQLYWMNPAQQGEAVRQLASLVDIVRSHFIESAVSWFLLACAQDVAGQLSESSESFARADSLWLGVNPASKPTDSHTTDANAPVASAPPLN